MLQHLLCPVIHEPEEKKRLAQQKVDKVGEIFAQSYNLGAISATSVRDQGTLGI